MAFLKLELPDELSVDREAESIMSAASNADSWKGFSMVKSPHMLDDQETMDFQDFAVMNSLNSPVFAFGLATGLGKTLCSWLSFLWFSSQVPVRVIVVTKHTSVLQYRSEFDKFFDSSKFRIQTVFPDMAKKKTDYAKSRKSSYVDWGNGKLDVLLMNWQIFQRDHDHILPSCNNLRKRGEIPFMIYDEVTAITNMTTKTHKAAFNCSRMALTPLFVNNNYVQGKVLGATATLNRGRIEKVYGMFKGMGCQLTRTKQEFMDRFVKYHEGDDHRKFIYGYKNTGEFVELLKPYVCIIRKRDVESQLPIFQPPRKILLDQCQEQINLIDKVYKGEWDKDKLDLDDPEGEEKFDNMLPLLIAGHTKRTLQDYRLVDKDRKGIYVSPKTEALLDILENEYTDEKVIVYCPSVTYLKILLKEIKKNKRKLAVGYREPLEISGRDLDPTRREQSRLMFQDFDSGRNLIFITQSGVEAINLQSAQSLILMTCPMTGGDMVQLAGRLARIGSEHSSLLITYLLMKDSQDEDEYDILNQQMHMISMIQGDVDEGLIDYDRLKYLKGIFDDYDDKKSMNQLIHSLFKRRKRASYYERRSK